MGCGHHREPVILVPESILEVRACVCVCVRDSETEMTFFTLGLFLTRIYIILDSVDLLGLDIKNNFMS